jgi:hypothetical protein
VMQKGTVPFFETAPKELIVVPGARPFGARQGRTEPSAGFNFP